jgi:hypothetical protein
MIGEIDLYGVLLPPLLVWLGIALVLSTLLRMLLVRVRFYRLVWHRPLFDLALLVILIGCVSVFANRIF